LRSGTPHTYHYLNTRDALHAGKHVLCEKPFTSNAAELRALIKLAKEGKLFLMEAMWTRFQVFPSLSPPLDIVTYQWIAHCT
jgi:predicted dehydrogenase